MVTLTIGTQHRRSHLPLKHLCRIDREYLSPGRWGGWYVTIHQRPAQWIKDHHMKYEARILGAAEVELDILDPRLAILFKLTWL